MSRQSGFAQEQQACLWLQTQGIVIVEQNYYCRYGEIDIIGKDKECLVFFEIKFRKNNPTNNAFGDGLEAVNWRKQQKITLCAQHYLSEKQRNESHSTPAARFDVIAMTPNNGPSKVSYHWVKNAFEG